MPIMHSASHGCDHKNPLMFSWQEPRLKQVIGFLGGPRTCISFPATIQETKTRTTFKRQLQCTHTHTHTHTDTHTDTHTHTRLKTALFSLGLSHWKRF